MIAVIGLGFVGLTTALGFSSKNMKVFGYDIDNEKLELLKKCRIPFYEPYLEDVLKKQININFIIAENIKEAVIESKIIFFCVGTPNDNEGNVDLTHLLKALESVVKEINKGDFKILVIKSTVPPSTTKDKIKPFIEELDFEYGKDIGLANNPEFLREGFAWDDFINPDRIVIGAEDKKCAEMLKEIYKPFNAPFCFVSLNTAEYIKYLSNTLLSTLISFSNDMLMIGKSIGGIDIASAFKILHLDRRWYGKPAKMTGYVYPGCGFGGYCLPKDTMALYMKAKNNGYESGLLKEVLNINCSVKEFLVREIENKIAKDKRLAILGLSFKSGSDDVRESPAGQMIRRLLEKGYHNLVAYDPVATDNFRNEYNLDIAYASSMEEALNGADAAIILTAWDEFRDKKDILKNTVVLDLRYYLN